MKTRQLWFTGSNQVEIREHLLPKLQSGEILVRSVCSAISAGTEMLVYRGQIPTDMALDKQIAALQNQMLYPTQYGYATVGRIDQVGADVAQSLAGKAVFAFQPHASYFITTPDQVVMVPDAIDPDAAVFLANMETAVNLVLDGNPRVGEQVVILGQGIVGLLTASILSRFPLAGLYAVDKIENRRARSIQMGADLAIDPGKLDDLKQRLGDRAGVHGADLVFELSGVPEVLNQAIALCGYAGRIIVGSWYGTRTAPVQLGHNFHRDRIQITSSQVSTIAPQLSGRWDKQRRYQVAWDMIEKTSPAQLISHRIPFGQASEAYQLLDNSPEHALQVILMYPQQ